MKIGLKTPTNETLKAAQIVLNQLGVTYSVGYKKDLDLYITDRSEKKHCPIILLNNEIYEKIAKLSRLEICDKEYADNLGWDEQREELLTQIENATRKAKKTLMRVHYFPHIKYKNSVSFSGDIDHLLQWDIIRQKQGIIKKLLTKILPNRLSYKWSMLAAGKYYNKDFVSFIHGGLAKLSFKIGTKMHLPTRCYITPFTLTKKNTFFVRPKKYLQEENTEMPPKGTGRKSYTAQPLKGLDLELHFGFTIGPYNNMTVESPYTTNIITEKVLKDQYKELKKQIGNISGTRLHHPYSFTPKIFTYLNKLDILYDSSAFSFGKSMGFDSTWTPNGTTLPYRPVLKEKTKYIELPVIYYEATQLPKKQVNATIIVSQHPDNTQTYFIKKLIKTYKKAWHASLKEVATWWQTREKIKIEQNKVSNAPENFGLILYPKDAEVSIQGYKEQASYTDKKYKYVQLTKAI